MATANLTVTAPSSGAAGAVLAGTVGNTTGGANGTFTVVATAGLTMTLSPAAATANLVLAAQTAGAAGAVLTGTVQNTGAANGTFTLVAPAGLTLTLGPPAATANLVLAGAATGAVGAVLTGTVQNTGAANGTFTLTPSFAALTVTLVTTAPPPPQPPASTNNVRNAQPLLFQPTDAVSRPTSFPGPGLGSIYEADLWGPTSEYVDFQSGWRWSNNGGDYIGANDLLQSLATPWATKPVNDLSTGTSSYTMDVTVLVQAVQTRGAWCAFRASLTGPNFRSIVGVFGAAGSRPSIAVSYVDGSSGTLICRTVAALQTPATLQAPKRPVTANPIINLPCAIEFDRPMAKAVQSASMTFGVVHFSGLATLELYLLKPPINTQQVTGGVAANAGYLDTNILAQPGVQGAMSMADGTVLSDYVVTIAGITVSAEHSFSPEFWGGGVNTSKLPYVAQHPVTGIARFVNPLGQITLVSSSYTGEGFVPLAPGIGALKIFMPSSGLTTGQEGGNGGTVGEAMKLYLPAANMWLQRTLFCRYYRRGGTPALRIPSQRVEVRQGGAFAWTQMSGKWGITADGETSYGGVSKTSGGGSGWTARCSWYDCDTGTGGPSTGGITVGTHIVDDYQIGGPIPNPVGYRYGVDTDPGYWGLQRERWGAIGGLGGVLYAGNWDCIEHEVTLNSVNAANNTFTPDGAIRTWVNGRLVLEETGMVMRTLPIYVPPVIDIGKLRPARELGVRGLWLNWFHGGQTQNTVDRTEFYTKPVWGTQRIGPMNLTPPVTGNYWDNLSPLVMPTLPASGNLGTLGTETMQAAMQRILGYAPTSNEAFRWTIVWRNWSTMNPVRLYNLSGQLVEILLVLHGGGHMDTGVNGTVAFSLRDLVWKNLQTSTLFDAIPTPDVLHGEDSTGRPISHHPYAANHGLDSNEPNGPALVTTRRGSGGKLATISGQTHIFRLTSNTWSRWGATHPPTDRTVHSTIKDKVRKRFVRIPQNEARADYYILDYSVNGSNPDWQVFDENSIPPAAYRIPKWSDKFYAVIEHDPIRDLYVGSNGNATDGIWAISPGALHLNWTKLSLTGVALPTQVGATENGQSMGMLFDSVRSRLMMVDNSTSTFSRMYELAAPASSPLTNNWNLTLRTFGGVASQYSFVGSGFLRDVNQRFVMIPEWDCFVMCGGYDKPMEVGKL
jgi:hypothetical protein